MPFRLCQQAAENLGLCTIHRRDLTELPEDKIAAGCSKSPDISPAQPRRAETRPVPSKAAADVCLTRGRWDDPNCARRTSTFLPCAFREQGDRPSCLVPLFQHPARESTSHRHSCRSDTAREPPLHRPVEDIRSQPTRKPTSAMWCVASENS